MAKTLAAVAMTTAATAASVLAFSCGGSSAASELDAGSAVPASDAGRRPPNDPPVEEPRPPEYDDDGWLRIDVDPNHECPSYTPTRSDQMPPAIEWEPCAEPLSAAYPSCRKMKTDGPFNQRLTGFSVGGRAGMVDANGNAVLAFARRSANVTHHLVGEADGPIRHAFHDGAGPCRLDFPQVAAGRVLYPLSRVPERGTQQLYRYGAIGGAFDEPVAVLEKMVEEHRCYSAGPDLFFDGRAFRAWAPNAPIVGSLGDPAHRFEPGSFVGDAFFYRPHTGPGREDLRIRIQQPDSGVRDFLWYGDDVASAAAQFGTDGKDMVWVEAFGRAHVGDSWAAIDLVTAPYTTDPTKIEKRRLRSMESLGSSPFVVGCGYAAPRMLMTPMRSLTRLRDGRVATLDDLPGDGTVMRFAATLTITCDEVFVALSTTFTDHVIARIRLSDFGFGDVPDGGP